MTGTILELFIATILFVGIHTIPSSFMKGAIVGKIGEKAYTGVFSLLSLGFLIWMIMAFIAAPYGDVIWEVGNWGRYLAIVAMLIASILFLGPFTGASATGVGGEKSVAKEGARSGINALTRHPLMWAFVLWAGVHLINNGDLKSIIFFAGFGSLALAGTYLIDAKRKRDVGDGWEKYVAHTSNIPFLALLQGRAKLSIKSIWWKALIGFVLFMAFFHLHTKVIGVSPFPL
ncbi:MAG: NnrU family protein [Sneathiella sp.]